MMCASVSRAELRYVFILGLVLNAIWEFAHAGLLYDMWGQVSLGSGLFHIALAIFGDAAVVVVIMLLACRAVGRRHVVPPDAIGWATLLVIGLLAGVLLEWIARTQDWWMYNDLMPTFSAMGETLGLSPVAQITLLPALTVYLGTRRRPRSNPHSAANG